MENKSKTNHLKTKVMSGLVWTFGERILAQGASFVISVLLARVLLPEEYGVIAIVMVFINLANVFVIDGLGEALVKKKDSEEVDFSTTFYCSALCSAILYLVIFVTAPIVAEFYQMPILVELLRVLGLKLPLSAISTIQHAYVSKHMIFKKFFFSTAGGTIFSGVLGIMMAHMGFGVWSLVAQYLLNTFVDTIVLFFTIPWRPRLLFSKDSAKELVGYGWKITISSFINVLYGEIRSLFIGRMYSSADLAYYNRGNQFPSLIITNVDGAIGKVMFPVMAKVDDDRRKSVAQRTLKTTSFLIFPLMTGLFVVAEPLVRVLLTDKWLFCVPYLRFGCIFYMCQPIQTTNWQIIKASGRSDLCLKLEIIKKIIGFPIIFLTIQYGVFAIAAGNAGFAVISMLINAIPNTRLIGYSLREQGRDLLPAILLSLFMGSIVWLISFANISVLLILFLQVVVGILVYIGGAYILKLDSLTYLYDTFKLKQF